MLAATVDTVHDAMTSSVTDWFAGHAHETRQLCSQRPTNKWLRIDDSNDAWKTGPPSIHYETCLASRNAATNQHWRTQICSLDGVTRIRRAPLLMKRIHLYISYISSLSLQLICTHTHAVRYPTCILRKLPSFIIDIHSWQIEKLSFLAKINCIS